MLVEDVVILGYYINTPGIPADDNIHRERGMSGRIRDDMGITL